MALFKLDEDYNKNKKQLFSLDGIDTSDTQREMALRKKQQEEMATPLYKKEQELKTTVKPMGLLERVGSFWSDKELPNPIAPKSAYIQNDKIKYGDNYNIIGETANKYYYRDANDQLQALDKKDPDLHMGLAPKQVEDYKTQWNSNAQKLNEENAKQSQAEFDKKNIIRKLGDRTGMVGANFLTGQDAFVPTTNNKVADIGTDISGVTAGMLFNPEGAAGANMFNASNGLADKVLTTNLANKLLPKSNALGRIANKAVEGAITSAPLSLFNSGMTTNDPTEVAKNLGRDLALGGVVGGAFGGIGEGVGLAKKGVNNIKQGAKNTMNEYRNTFNNPFNGISGAAENPVDLYTPTLNSKAPIKDLVSNRLSQLENTPNTKFEPSKIKIEPFKPENNINLPLEGNKPFKMNLGLFADDGVVKGNFKSGENLAPDLKDRIVNSQDLSKKSFKDKLNNVKDNLSTTYKQWFDNENATNKFSKVAGDDTYMKAINTKKANGTVDYIANDALVDKMGNKVGEPLKNIAKDIPAEKENDFWTYMLLRHNTARYKEGKPIFSDIDSKASLDRAYELEQANPEFRNLGKRVSRFLDTFSEKWLKDTGLTSEDMLDNMRAKYSNYIPTNREYSELEKGFVDGAKRGYTNQPSTIRSATGSDRKVINPMENILNLVNRTVTAARRNEVGQSMLKALREKPQELNQFAEILPPDYNGRLDLDNIVTVRENGEPVHIKVNNKEFLETINGLSNSNMDHNSMVKKANTLFKGLITQYNPIFAVRNMARDIPTAFVYGTEKNPIKFATDLVKAGKDIVKNDSSYQQYRALGGNQNNFFSPDNVTKFKEDFTKTSKNPFKKILNGIEYFNNLTESAPRLAEFKRTLERGGTPQEALYNSGETTVNFSRGGEKAKKVDKYVPYFNASLQGIDRFARAVKNNPKGTIAKGLTAITLPTVAQEAWNNSIDPEGYKNLDNRTKDTYFVFATGDGDFIKIPKSREMGVLFSSLAQRVQRKLFGEDDAFKDFFTKDGNPLKGTLATNFAPTNPIENNLASPIVNLGTNKDFAGRDIVPRQMLDDKRSAYLQYDDKTTSIAKKMGELTGLSPKQIDYVIKSYTGVIGQFLQPATTKGGNPLNTLTSQFKADSTNNSKVMDDFYDTLDTLKQKATDKNITENIPTKKVTNEEKIRNAFDKAVTSFGDISKKINQTDDMDEKKALKQKMVGIANQLNKAAKSNDLRTMLSIDKQLPKKKK